MRLTPAQENCSALKACSVPAAPGDAHSYDYLSSGFLFVDPWLGNNFIPSPMEWNCSSPGGFSSTVMNQVQPTSQIKLIVRKRFLLLLCPLMPAAPIDGVFVACVDCNVGETLDDKGYTHAWPIHCNRELCSSQNTMQRHGRTYF